MIDAVNQGSADALELLVQLSCDIDETKDMGCTSAITAAMPDHVELLPLLLSMEQIQIFRVLGQFWPRSMRGNGDSKSSSCSSNTSQTSIRPLTSMRMKTHSSRTSSLLSRIRMSSRICDRKGRKPWMSYGLKAKGARIQLAENAGYERAVTTRIVVATGLPTWVSFVCDENRRILSGEPLTYAADSSCPSASEHWT